MEFKKYSSLENAHREKFTDACRNLGIKEWVATVKVHGANFGFICDETCEITPFKRTSTIGKNPDTGAYDFYGCNNVVEEYTQKVKELANLVGGPVQVYGELYGQGVQKEINYGEKDFIMFEVLTKKGWLKWDEIVQLGKQTSIPTVPELARGSLEEMLSLSTDFACPLSPTSDKAEGYVVKPLYDVDTTLTTGSRPIIKNKSKAFSEKKQKVPKKPFKLPEHIKPIMEEFNCYLTENRLNNVLSKMDATSVTHKDFGKVLGAFVQDAKSEFERDEYEISKDDWKLMAKSVNKEAGNVVRGQWLNILDQYFLLTWEDV